MIVLLKATRYLLHTDTNSAVFSPVIPFQKSSKLAFDKKSSNAPYLLKYMKFEEKGESCRLKNKKWPRPNENDILLFPQNLL